MQVISIDKEYLTLAQFLKLIDLVSSGGQAKYFLVETEVLVNGELENRRNKKLYDQDIISIFDKEYQIVCT